MSKSQHTGKTPGLVCPITGRDEDLVLLKQSKLVNIPQVFHQSVSLHEVRLWEDNGESLA